MSVVQTIWYFVTKRVSAWTFVIAQTKWWFVIKDINWWFKATQENYWYFKINVPTGNWILKDGFWDDDGIWIDSEIWKDS